MAQGIQINIVAIEPYFGTGYSTARMRVVRKLTKEPKTPKQAFEIWWQYADIKRESSSSSIERILHKSGSHELKLFNYLKAKKTNVLVYPLELKEAADANALETDVDRMVWKVVRWFDQYSMYTPGEPRTDKLQNYRAWMYELAILGGTKALPMADEPWCVQYPQFGVERAYARIQKFIELFQNNWVGTQRLYSFRESKEAWSEEDYLRTKKFRKSRGPDDTENPWEKA